MFGQMENIETINMCALWIIYVRLLVYVLLCCFGAQHVLEWLEECELCSTGTEWLDFACREKASFFESQSICVLSCPKTLLRPTSPCSDTTKDADLRQTVLSDLTETTWFFRWHHSFLWDDVQFYGLKVDFIVTGGNSRLFSVLQFPQIREANKSFGFGYVFFLKSSLLLFLYNNGKTHINEKLY